MLEQLEQPLHPEQKKQVIEAIRKLGFKVVPAEVAAEANLPVATATLQLNRVAAETNAGLQVSHDGNLTYVFDPRFEQSYAFSATRNVFQRVGRVVANLFLSLAKIFFLASFFILRMSIGIILVLSVVLIIVVAVVALIRLLDGGSGDSGGGGGGGDVNLGGIGDAFSGGDYVSRPGWAYWTFDWLWDWWYYGDYLWGRPYYYSAYPSYLDDFHYANGNSGIPKKSTAELCEQADRKKKSKFLDNCYTLLFGAGDPNAGLEQKRWYEIAQVIRVNLGVVIAEQIAPYFDSHERNEDWMIPVLVRFNGMPDVTESGTIIYSFPSFQQRLSMHEQTQTNLNEPPQCGQPVNHQQSDADQLRALVRGHMVREKALKQAEAGKDTVESYLAEQRWTLGVDPDGYWQIYCFAGFAVAGSLSLLKVSATLPFGHILQMILIGILIYGSIFFLIPACRWCINEQRNRGIDERNDRRATAAALVRSPSKDLQHKLNEARAAAGQALATGNDQMVYTTEKDELEQRFN
ncbi:MAG TPA: hypothetical protein V6D22_21355 [Candidatus Obscuribacterales bacterium]